MCSYASTYKMCVPTLPNLSQRDGSSAPCQDFIRTAAPPPDWLEKAWTGAKRRGLDTLTPADVDAEIAAHRRKPDPITPGGVK